MARKNNKPTLFIEGGNVTRNGDLRQGFGKLLAKVLGDKVKKVRIKLCGAKDQAIKAYLSTDGKKFLLIDLDCGYEEKQSRIKDLNSKGCVREEYFFMIQTMEAWLLSQPNVLSKYYGQGIEIKGIQGKNWQNQSSPVKILNKLTKSTQKGKYHKVKHGSELLALLDAQSLMDDFPEFKRMIETLKKL